MKVVHSWLKEYVGEDLPEAKEIERLLNFHSFEVDEVYEQEGETVLDVDVLPNRSSDSLCHRGIARELATILDLKLKHDPLATKPELSNVDSIQINIDDPESCPRFTLSLITGVTVKESPEWLQNRIRALGQRPINNIVDATNYVMYAIGQPMHAYDADLLSNTEGQWKVGVRPATEGEKISLLAEGGKEEDRIVELKGSELLVVDGATNNPLGLAGIKGGRKAELHAETKNILLEAANFNPRVIRQTARRLGILTDASKRFENEPSRELPVYAQHEAIKLITEIAGGVCEGLADSYPAPLDVHKTKVSTNKVNSLLGLTLTSAEVKRIIERTGSSVVEEDEGVYTVIAPWERTDLVIEEDYIEEVGRIHGLHNIKSIPPEKRVVSKVNVRHYYSEQIRMSLMSQGFSEVITSSFQKKGSIQLQNAFASDKSYVRESLRKNIEAVLDANFVSVDLLGLNDVRVFEIGTVFYKTEEGVGECVSLTLGVRTKGNGYNKKDDEILQLGCQAVSDGLSVPLNWQIDKGVAEVNLSEVFSRLPIPSEYDQLPEKKDVSFQPISPYPAVARDIALWVDDTEKVDSVAETITSSAGPLLVRQTLFDTFTKEGRTSYAFRLVFQSSERTLTDIEVNAVMENIYKSVTDRGWEVR